METLQIGESVYDGYYKKQTFICHIRWYDTPAYASVEEMKNAEEFFSSSEYENFTRCRSILIEKSIPELTGAWEYKPINI